MAIGVPTVVGAAAIVHDTVSALVGVLAENEGTRGTGSWIEEMDRTDSTSLYGSYWSRNSVLFMSLLRTLTSP